MEKGSNKVEEWREQSQRTGRIRVSECLSCDFSPFFFLPFLIYSRSKPQEINTSCFDRAEVVKHKQGGNSSLKRTEWIQSKTNVLKVFTNQLAPSGTFHKVQETPHGNSVHAKHMDVLHKTTWD